MTKIKVNGVLIAKVESLESISIVEILEETPWNLEVSDTAEVQYSLDHIGGRPDDRHKKK